MKVLSCEISIGAFKFIKCTSVEINLSNRDLINTAIITLPASAVLKNENNNDTYKDTAKIFNRGDAVSISLGYDGNNKTEFEGFVSKVDPARPTVIECEDNAFLLRSVNLNKSYQTTTLKTLLSDVVAGTGLKLSEGIPTLNVTKVVLEDTSGLEVLAELKKVYGLISYFNRNGELYCGLTYTETFGNVRLKTDVNVIDNKDLTTIDQNDKKVLIKAKVFLPNGTNKTIEVGEKGGETRTIFLYNVASDSEVKELAENELKKQQSVKLDGTIETFIQPEILNGDSVQYEDIDYPERNGKYYIDAVNVTFGDGGARRKLEFGVKL